jgi:microcystin-dependent protein
MPSHTHLQNSHFHTAAVFATDANGSNFDRSAGGGAQGQATTNEATATNQNTGGGLSHNNLQPYITVYF